MPAGRAFISHAYADPSTVTRLARLLPPEVAPFVFPEVHGDPRLAVSNGIVQEIRTADSLIWVDEGASATSEWVNFERDYAPRAGVPVFRFDPGAVTLERDNRRPVDLTAELVVSAESFDRAVQLMRWLTEERSFAFTKTPTVLRMKEIPSEFIRLLERGVPMVWLVDRRIAAYLKLAFGSSLEDFDELDGMRSLSGWELWLQENSVFVRISENWQVEPSADSEENVVWLDVDPARRAFALEYGIDLTADVAAEGINWNRADDLVVRLTMLAQRTFPFFRPAGENED